MTGFDMDAYSEFQKHRYDIPHLCPECGKDTSVVLHICTMGEALYGCVGLRGMRFCSLDDYLTEYLPMFPWFGKNHRELGFRVSRELTLEEDKRLTDAFGAIPTLSDEESERRIEEAMRSNAPLPGGVVRIPMSALRPPSELELRNGNIE